ncbi:MAG: hypothetical protein NTX03_05530, partial [Bacteroidetes bacterium]|nr:hypothetical protein [Bacteroidota bacterium]
MAKKKTITAQEEKPKQTHAEELELKGKVQQVKELWYKAIESDKDGVIPGKMLGSKYDTKNRLFNFNKHGGKTEEYTFGITGAYTKGTYNEKGVYQQSESYRIDGVLEWRAVSLYDERGNGSGTICYNAEGGVMWRNTITFNEMNKITGIYNYNPQDELSYWSENKYDDKGNQTESKIYSKDGEVTNWQTYKYNDKNDCIELNFYKPDGSLERSSSYSYEYDSDGKRINNYTPPEKKLHESYTYKYDKHGNWIEKIKRFKNVAELIVKRDITYYNDPSEKLELNINIPYNVDAEGEITAKNTEALESLTAQQAMWLAEGSPTPDAFSATRYFVVKNNEVPSSTVLTKQNVEVIALMHALTEEKGAKLVHTYKTA